MELRAMANFIKPDLKIMKIEEQDEIIELSKIVLKFVKVLIITRGSKGVITIKRDKDDSPDMNIKNVYVKVYPTNAINAVENVSGAGDCFASGFLYGILQDLQESQCIAIGFGTAKQALLSKETVPIDFDIK